MKGWNKIQDKYKSELYLVASQQQDTSVCYSISKQEGSYVQSNQVTIVQPEKILGSSSISWSQYIDT